MILDLGCGKHKFPGAVGMDNVMMEGVNIVHDLLDFPYPFEDKSVSKIVLSHVLEHFHIEETAKIMREVFRILRDDGEVYIALPHAGSIDAFGDPTHKSFFTFRSIVFFDSTCEHVYYKVLDPFWEIKRVWASVNLKNVMINPPSKWDVMLSDLCSKVLNWTMGEKRNFTLTDGLVKHSFFHLVNIHCMLKKAVAKPSPSEINRRNDKDYLQEKKP